MEKIRFEDILEGVKEEWSIIEKAKYLYNQICKLSRYDERIIYTNNQELINSIYNKKVSISEPIEPIFICKTMNSIYMQLLNRLGIKCKIIEKPTLIKAGLDDIALIIYDENDTPYFTAIAGDIQRCKYGMKTQFFGGIDRNYPEVNEEKVKILKSDELREIDEKVEYIEKDKEYSDNVFNLIAEEVKQNNEFRKILLDNPNFVKEYLKMNNIGNVNDLTDKEIQEFVKGFTVDDIFKIKMMILNLFKHNDKNYGYIENKKHSIELFQSIFNKSEKRRYDTFDMIKETEDGLEIISLIRVKLKDDYIYYKYNPVLREYLLLPIEEALQISKEYNSKSGKDLIIDR